MSDHQSASHLTLLIIEPSEQLAARWHALLLEPRLPGLDVGLAQSLREALHHLSARHVDVVLMDLTLPDYKGADAVRAFRTTMPNCPLVVYHPGDDERLLLDAVRNGAHEALVPFAFDAASVRMAMKIAKARSHHPAPPGAVPGGLIPPARTIHDLNNALTSINGFADVLLSRLPPDDAARPLLDHIRQAGRQAAALLKLLPALPAAQFPMDRRSALTAL
jgi:CheY-like chemotaxis protein